MVRGLNLFKTNFAPYQDRYILIGGTASTILMDEAGLQFRATKDLDIVLCIEAFDAEFSAAIWRFVQAGGYAHREKSTGRPEFYRFDNPKDEAYPQMIELFSRVPDALHIDSDSHLTPIPAGEEVSSLSAILLENVYYNFIRAGVQILQELPIVGPDRLIPLKARAWLDMTHRRDSGSRIDERDIRKHRNDVIRLYTVLDPIVPVATPVQIQEDLSHFLASLSVDGTLKIADLGVRDTSIEEIVKTLKLVFGL
jgi:hypothetical protein